MTLTRLGPIAAALFLLAAACGDDGPSHPSADAMITIDLPTADAPTTPPTDGPKPKLDGPGPKADAPVVVDMPNGPWVKIVSPADNATVKNPVTFTIAANKVATVRIYADKWPLSAAWNPATKTTLSYTFNGLGFARTVELFGYDGAGKELAKQTITITVQSTNLDKGTLVGQMYNTYYYLANEADYTGTANTDLNDSSCSSIVKTSANFSDAVCIEGSGKLKDGRVINYAKKCSCGRPCPTGGIVCYSVLDKTKFPWGMGNKSNALVPLRSWAVDTSVIPSGTILYAEQWDGVKIPALSGIGNFTHDGCFRADDVGGGIKGMHYDFFAGTKPMWLALEKLFKTKTYFTVYKNPGRCSHLKP